MPNLAEGHIHVRTPAVNPKLTVQRKNYVCPENRRRMRAEVAHLGRGGFVRRRASLASPFGLELHLIPELLQALDQVTSGAFGFESEEVVGTEISILRAVFDDVVQNYQQ